MTRFDWLAEWFASARSTFVEATWERRFWVVVSIVGLIVPQVRESLPAVFFMSSWALVKGSSNERSLAKHEMLEEKAEEAES